ncbi:MAG: phosphoribosylamine--glycine ligase [Ignavibacteriales bacterium]|nr:phosphoribosylamine--glycine ligase [Ignavibacteriales bacterium]
MNIAIVGSGGREHALSWKLQVSPLVGTVYTIPGNGGIENSIALDIADYNVLLQWCRKQEVSLLVVGPENHLAAGIVDFFAGTEIMVFGPDKTASQLESSKSFAKSFMSRYGVATAKYVSVEEPYDASSLAKTAAEFNGKVVIKYDGLAAGKGVFVCNTQFQIDEAIATILSRYGNTQPIVFEELLSGPELSYIGLTDGRTVKLFQASQDHKRLLDNDEGPNTGGMGAYTPVTMADSKVDKLVMDEIVLPTLKGITNEHFNYKGFIYFGVLMDNGKPYLLEYNVRMGDPETEVLLPSLKTDLLELVLATLAGKLDGTGMEFYPGSFVDVVMVAKGYPGDYQTGNLIHGLETTIPGTWVFHAGTKKMDAGIVSSGGRVLNIVAHGADFNEAREKAYRLCSSVQFEDCFYRCDIGAKNI